MKKVYDVLGGLWKSWLLIIFAITLIVSYPLFWYHLKLHKNFNTAFALMRFWGRFLQFFTGLWSKVIYKSPLPKSPYVICSNHGSYLDILLMFRVFPEYFVFMGKREILNWPLFHIFFSSGMNIPVNRTSIKDAHRAFDRIGEEVDKGHNVVIFPEGGIPYCAPELARFKNGAFKLAISKGIPIVPVTFATNWRRLDGSTLFKGIAGPGICKAIVHKPIDTSQMTQDDLVDLRESVFKTIQQPLIDNGSIRRSN